jgi:hypothetical protein
VRMFARVVLSVICVVVSPVSIALAQSGGTFTATGNMITARSGHTATLLLSGKVLIAGGSNGLVNQGSYISYIYGTPTAELFDPTIGSFTPTGEMITPRRGHTATLLPDGRVLVVGGFDMSNNWVTPSAELYDPASGTFTALGDVSPTTQQVVNTATLLNNGKVLIAGIGPNARLYDPQTRASRTPGHTALRPPGWWEPRLSSLMAGS